MTLRRVAASFNRPNGLSKFGRSRDLSSRPLRSCRLRGLSDQVAAQVSREVAPGGFTQEQDAVAASEHRRGASASARSGPRRASRRRSGSTGSRASSRPLAAAAFVRSRSSALPPEPHPRARRPRRLGRRTVETLRVSFVVPVRARSGGQIDIVEAPTPPPACFELEFCEPVRRPSRLRDDAGGAPPISRPRSCARGPRPRASPGGFPRTQVRVRKRASNPWDHASTRDARCLRGTSATCGRRTRPANFPPSRRRRRPGCIHRGLSVRGGEARLAADASECQPRLNSACQRGSCGTGGSRSVPPSRTRGHTMRRCAPSSAHAPGAGRGEALPSRLVASLASSPA